MRKFWGVVAYVVSGFFFYMVLLLAFVNEPPALMKLLVMGIFAVPAVISLFVGLTVLGFARWKRDVGAVLVSAAAFVCFIVLTFWCMFNSPELQHMMTVETKAFFSDVVTGGVAIVMMLTVGCVLLWQAKTNVSEM